MKVVAGWQLARLRVTEEHCSEPSVRWGDATGASGDCSGRSTSNPEETNFRQESHADLDSGGEIIGGPAVFADPGTVAPAHLRSRYIGGFQFLYALGAALGAVVGGTLFVRMGHGVWPVLGLVGVLAATLGVMSVRPPGTVRPAPRPLPEPTS
jgi:MFS family permease